MIEELLLDNGHLGLSSYLGLNGKLKPIHIISERIMLYHEN